MDDPTLQYLNRVLPYQKPSAVKKQAEILGVEPNCSAIANKMLDSHLSQVLVCIQGGRETSLDSGHPEALVTVMPLIDTSNWGLNLVFPLSGTRQTVLNTLKTLTLTKK